MGQLAGREEGHQGEVHLVLQRVPDLGSGGRCLHRQPILAADDQAGAVVLAPLVTVDVRVDVLRLVEGPANTSAVILQEMTVPHHLELARSDAAGASLGPIGQQKVNCDFLSRMTTPVVIGEKLPSPQQNRPA